MQKINQNRKTPIFYGKSEDAWEGYQDFLIKLIHKYNIKTVCDIGGGANPVLHEDYIAANELQYSILDISDVELEKAPKTYDKIVADIASSQFTPAYEFDLVFSKMLAEHVKDARQFHINIWNILHDGGLAVHFFPTLFTLPFLVNKFMPDRLTTQLLDKVSPRDKYQQGKFPAFYHWCWGPHNFQIQKFVDLGYEVLEYWGYFGHSSYYRKIKLLERLHQKKTRYLLRHPNPFFTSFAYLVLRKVNW